MGKAKSAADTLRRGCERSSEKESNIVNRELVLRKIQPAVERSYAKKMQLWLECVISPTYTDIWLTSVCRYQKQKPEASPDDLKSLKDFVRKMAYSIDGEEGIDVPGSETVRKYWNTFTAAWQRANPEQSIPRGIAQSVTEVCISFFVSY